MNRLLLTTSILLAITIPSVAQKQLGLVANLDLRSLAMGGTASLRDYTLFHVDQSGITYASFRRAVSPNVSLLQVASDGTHPILRSLNEPNVARATLASDGSVVVATLDEKKTASAIAIYKNDGTLVSRNTIKKPAAWTAASKDEVFWIDNSGLASISSRTTATGPSAAVDLSSWFRDTTPTGDKCRTVPFLLPVPLDGRRLVLINQSRLSLAVVDFTSATLAINSLPAALFADSLKQWNENQAPMIKKLGADDPSVRAEPLLIAAATWDGADGILIAYGFKRRGAPIRILKVTVGGKLVEEYAAPLGAFEGSFYPTHMCSSGGRIYLADSRGRVLIYQ